MKCAIYTCAHLRLENLTTKDFENIKFKVYTGNETVLLNQQTEIVDTPYIIPWAKDYDERLKVPEGKQATEHQIEEYRHNREFHLAVFNRGQKLRLSFLCTNPNDDNYPYVHVSTLSKGLKFKESSTPYLVLNPIMGVPIPSAIIRAFIICIIVVLLSGFLISNIWAASILCMFVGLTGQIFGALFFKAERFIKNLIAG